MPPLTIVVPRGAEAAAVRRARPSARVVEVAPGAAGAAGLPEFEEGETVIVLGLCGALWRLKAGDVAIYGRIADAAHAFVPDPPLTDALKAALPGATVVNACTSKRVVTTISARAALAERFNATVVDMEGTHLAAALALRGVRFAMVRVVSDDASRDLPPIADAIDEQGRLHVMRLAVAFAHAPRAAFAFVRDVRCALGTLSMTAHAVGQRRTPHMGPEGYDSHASSRGRTVRPLLERYDAGERVAVWEELRALGSLEHADGALRQAARDVAQRTMQRAAANLATIHRRLIGFGYVFDKPKEALVKPSAGTAKTLRLLRAKIGPVPYSLEAWFEQVGYVFFRGHPASWGGSHHWHDELLDPIEFMYDSSWVQDQFEYIAEYGGEDDPDEAAFHFEFAGDFYHKNEVSGGSPTYAVLPSFTADVRIFEDNGARYTDFVDSRPGDDDGIWFVDYLRRYFERGGFRRMRPDHTYPPAFWPGLAEGLLEI
jgi:Phosphorylase superfamily